MKYFIEEKITTVSLGEYLLKTISIYKWFSPLTDEEMRDREKEVGRERESEGVTVHDYVTL